MSRACLIVVSLLLTPVAPLWAQSGDQIATLNPSAVQIPRSGLQTWTFTAPNVQAGSVVAIELNARLWGGPVATAGKMFGYVMDIRLNGKPVNGAIDRLRQSLRNREAMVGGHPMWASYVGWRVISAPDFGPSSAVQYGSDPFRYVIEIQSVLESGTNQLSIQYVAPPSLQGSALYIQKLRLDLLPAQQTGPRPLVLTSKAPVSFEARGDGAISVKTTEASFPFTTYLSIPGGGWARLGPAVTSGPSAVQLRPRILSSTSTTKVQRAGTAAYSIQRTIYSQGERTQVDDQITNTTGSDLGIAVKYDAALSGSPANVYLCGNNDPMLDECASAPNPTIFAPLGTSGLGLVAEDDVLRAQGRFSFNKSGHFIEVKTQQLAIPAGQSVVLRWSIYQISGGDYYDFINRVRSDWHIHVTLDGPWWWDVIPDLLKAHMTDDQIKTFLNRVHVSGAVIGTWYNPQNPKQIALGTGIMDPSFAQYRETLKAVVARLHNISPGLKVIIYTNAWYVSPDANPGADFKDSSIVAGNHQRYTQTWRGSTNTAYGVFPTLTSSYGAAYRDALRQLQAEVHNDGFFFDESNGPGQLSNINDLSSYAPYTFNQWDGHSAILNPQTSAIQQKIGYFSLLSGPYLNHLWTGLIQTDRQTIMANGEPSTRGLDDPPRIHFVETQELREAFNAQLYTPLAFNYNFGYYTVKDLRDRLDLGVLYCVTSPRSKIGVVDKFFPITPTEIHAGWIVGEERVITDRSRKYGWSNYSGRVRIWSYHSDGSSANENPSWVTANGFTQVDVPDGGIAILERETSGH